MEIVVPIVTYAGGLVSGVVLAFAKAWVADWQTRQAEGRARAAERRDRRSRYLDMISDGVRGRMGIGDALIREAAAFIDDTELSEYVGRYIVGDTRDKRSDAQGDVAFRIGQLRKEV